MPGPDSEILLDIRDLTIGFSQNGKVISAAEKISFSIKPAEILAVVGESGSGKTVTALSVMRLLNVPEARIESECMRFRTGSDQWVDITAAEEEVMRKLRGRHISMVFQDPMTSLNPVYTCGDQVLEMIQEHLGLSRAKASIHMMDLFREVKLPDPDRIGRSYPHQLSGGQRQRVMIAMAISCHPSLLIADEPTTALDVTVQRRILQLLLKLRAARKMSIMFITHDLGLIAGFADTVMVMKQGRIVEQGNVNKVFGSPDHPYTRGLLACRPASGVRLKKLPTVADFNDDDRGRKNEILSAGERKVHLKKIYSEKPVLRVEGIIKRFQSGKAVDQVSFEVYPGETLGIAGESGCGKTTLARVVLELINPDEGRIFFRGEDITVLSGARIKSLRKHLQIIFQDPYSSLNPRMTAGEMISEPLKVHRLYGNRKKRKKRTIELLEMVGLTGEHRLKYPHEMSGGQRQRIGIARALAVEPQLVICDEAVSALDISVQAQVLNLLNDLKKNLGLTFIFISHDLSVVRYMSDRILIMKGGRIIETGDADRIFEHPKNEYTRTLIQAIPGKGFLESA